MTYKDKLKQDTGLDVNGAGCPCYHGYEERQGFTVHCTAMSCEECWNREMKEKENGNMKYKVGDTVLVQAEVVAVNDDPTDKWPLKVRFSDDETNWFSESDLFKLPKPDKTYEQGLQDAWELARKLFAQINLADLQKMFGDSDEGVIIMSFDVQEVLAKLKAYEEAQEIKVGDVVEYEEYPYLITYTYGNVLRGMSKDGIGIVLHTNDDVKKTGKHIDIAGFLEQIKGE